MADEHGDTSRYPRIDLPTVRETLAYMHDDMRASPALAKVQQALRAAMQEIDALEGAAQAHGAARGPARVAGGNVTPFPTLRLVPWASRG